MSNRKNRVKDGMKIKKRYEKTLTKASKSKEAKPSLKIRLTRIPTLKKAGIKARYKF